ncbi:DNA internalization-related competence protein ComEC/Rec2 [Denitromonas halophila]|uniref:DNA internalization-related competence protein ComEC/Rec2 n=2 Tax=Denitromonas halophila TaxID=1629404 RepID=A0A557QKN8_9RHOO|nr:DNA internalization-related competence protein ComEC/Rec2 [Denitromonas halophila]
MQMAIFGVLLALLIVQHGASVLPVWGSAGLCLLAAVVAVACWCTRNGWQRQALCLMLGLSVGVAYGSLRAQWRLADQLDDAFDGATYILIGTVVGLPGRPDDGLRFEFAPDVAPVGLPSRLSLSWYPKPGAVIPTIVPGQRLMIEARLKVIRGQHNPNGFDYAGWQFARGVGGLGYVRTLAPIDAPVAMGVGARIDRWRDAIRARIHRSVEPDIAGVLTAMAVGDQRGMSDATWSSLRNTGTAHLVAISGLHVSIVAMLFGGLVGWLWRRIPRAVLWQPAQRATVVAAAVAALAYGALAGFGVPVTRSVLMLLTACVALLSSRRPPASRIWLLALLGVMVFDPWCVISAGFWLSFGAVGALILMLSGRHGVRGRVSGFASAQLAVTVLTAPLLLVLFGQLSLVSPLANAVAIPLVSILVVPLVLLGALLPGDFFLVMAAFVMEHLMSVLTWAADLPFAVWSMATPPVSLMLLALVGALWGIMPRGTPWRVLGWVAWAPVLLWSPPRPSAGTFEARVIDVGQGLAVHVRTAKHDVLYDTGPGYYRGGDAGERHVVPYLQDAGVGTLDLLVVSHDDMDHAGGAVSVLRSFPVRRLVTGQGVALGAGPAPTPCHAGKAWIWDGVTFRWLHPAADAQFRDDNDRSCVLHVSVPGGSLLLPGDVSSRAERAVAAVGGWPTSTVVVAPHHGSRSASSEALVAAVNADHVVFSSAYGNAFGHPVVTVLERWHDAGARIWRTDLQGAVSVRLGTTGARLGGEHAERPRYWHRKRADPRRADARLMSSASVE